VRRFPAGHWSIFYNGWRGNNKEPHGICKGFFAAENGRNIKGNGLHAKENCLYAKSSGLCAKTYGLGATESGLSAN